MLSQSPKDLCSSCAGRCVGSDVRDPLLVMESCFRPKEVGVGAGEEPAAETLTAVTQLVRHHSTKLKVAGSIPSQGTCLGCRFSSQSGRVRGNGLVFLTSVFLSLSFSLHSPLSKNK